MRSSEAEETARPGVSRRMVLAGAGAVAALAAIPAWRRVSPRYAGGHLSVAQAHDAAVGGAVLLIDIRTPKEWRQTGIGEGAHPLDMRRKDFVDAVMRLAGNDRDRKIALICARGVRSARTSRRLSDAGFAAIIDVPEGMLGSRAGPGWLGSGLPVTPWSGDPS